MGRDKGVIVKCISDVIEVSTNHGIGLKKILVSGVDTDTSLTQIAYIRIEKNSVIEMHSHPTMDEHFIILAGKCVMLCDSENYKLSANNYIYVPAGTKHELEVLESLDLLTIGIATDENKVF